jgi:zinc protease
MLGRMSLLGQSPEVLEQQRETLLAMTLDDFTEVIETYLDESQMIYVVVGDAKTQLGRMAKLGYGEPVLLDIYGRRR